MIAQLTGRIEAVEEGRCVVEVGGVGYLVHASTRTLQDAPGLPSPVRLLIETVVREDAITLYGFSTAAERGWFRLLTTVQGVGAKVALAILSALSPHELSAAIAGGDRAALTRAAGVGAKLAIRLLTELRDRGPDPGPFVPAATPALARVPDEAVSALLNLGYRRPEAVAAVGAALDALGPDAAIDAVLREGLRHLAQRTQA